MGGLVAGSVKLVDKFVEKEWRQNLVGLAQG